MFKAHVINDIRLHPYVQPDLGCSHPTIKDPSPENQLRDALLCYFKSRLGGTDKEFQQWYTAINNATQGWKMLEPNSNKTKSINQEYDIPDWFMLAIHATI